MDTVRTLKKQLKSKGAEDIVILPSEKGVCVSVYKIVLKNGEILEYDEFGYTEDGAVQIVTYPTPSLLDRILKREVKPSVCILNPEEVQQIHFDAEARPQEDEYVVVEESYKSYT